MKLLLNTGKVEVDFQDGYYGRTLLSEAARGGNDAIVKLLLDTGKIDINSRDRDGETALTYVCWNGNEAIIQLLQEYQRARMQGLSTRDCIVRTGVVQLTNHGEIRFGNRMLFNLTGQIRRRDGRSRG